MHSLGFNVFIVLFLGLVACQPQNAAQVQYTNNTKANRTTVAEQQGNPADLTPIKKTEEEWKALLTAEEFRVLREDGTERAFTGKFWDHEEQGVYTCAACKLPLFESSTKFKSGTGWPSFYQPIKSKHVHEESDSRYGMVRTEVSCARCNGHLGHVFKDGPLPTGLRYCINSVSLDFEKKP